MKEHFPQGPEARKEQGPSQEDVDGVFLRLSRYEGAGVEMSRVVHALLSRDGIEMSVEAIDAGGAEVDGTPRDVSIETDGVNGDGTFTVSVYVNDRFNRVEGETLTFKKHYRLKASQAALDARRAHDERARQERDAEDRERKDRLDKALAVFRPFAKAHLGQTLTPEDWSAAGLSEVFMKQGLPEGGSWKITEEDGNRLRATIMDAKGHVYDVYEFDAE